MRRARRERIVGGRAVGPGAQRRGGAAEAGEAPHAVDQRHAGEEVAALAAAAQLGELALEALMLGERGQDRQRAVPLSRKRNRRVSCLPMNSAGLRPIAAAAPGESWVRRSVSSVSHIQSAAARRKSASRSAGAAGAGGARRAAGPAGDGERDLLALRLGADPEIDVLLAVGGERGARDGDAEPAGEPGERGDLRHGEHAALVAAGLGLERGERRIGRDQPALGIDAAGDRRLAALGGGAHAASAAGRARVEMRATLAR